MPLIFTKFSLVTYLLLFGQADLSMVSCALICGSMAHGKKICQTEGCEVNLDVECDTCDSGSISFSLFSRYCFFFLSIAATPILSFYLTWQRLKIACVIITRLLSRQSSRELLSRSYALPYLACIEHVGSGEMSLFFTTVVVMRHKLCHLWQIFSTKHKMVAKLFQDKPLKIF